MVCKRCIAAVEHVMTEVGISFESIALGEVEIKETPSADKLSLIGTKLKEKGFELLDDQKKKLIEKIKNKIVDQVHHGQHDTRFNLSTSLSSILHKDYSYLSHLFSEVEGQTIENYMIQQKIEKAKELLAYNEATLSEIAYQLGYSSVAHLSAQFKKVTGLTPTHFKQIGKNHRRPIDDI